MPGGFFYFNSLIQFIFNRKGFWGGGGGVKSFSCFIEIPIFNANSVDSDQALPSAESIVYSICQQYLSLLSDARS